MYVCVCSKYVKRLYKYMMMMMMIVYTFPLGCSRGERDTSVVVVVVVKRLSKPVKIQYVHHHVSLLLPQKCTPTSVHVILLRGKVCVCIYLYPLYTPKKLRLEVIEER